MYFPTNVGAFISVSTDIYGFVLKNNPVIRSILLLLKFQFSHMKYILLFLIFWSPSAWSQPNFEMAQNDYTLGKYGHAKVLFEKFLQQCPQDLKSIEYLGDIECHLQHWQTAVSIYRQLLIKKPLEAEYHYKYGGALAMLAKDSNKLKALSMISTIKAALAKAIALNPRHIGARWAMIELYLQLPGILGGSGSKAVEYSRQLAKISPIDGYLSRGRIEEYFDRYSNAEMQYKKAIEAGNSRTTYQKLADLYQNKMQQPEKAREVLAAFNQKNKS